MIIFDLDGTLADCEHRRHFVDPAKNDDYVFWSTTHYPEFKGGWYSMTETDPDYPGMRKQWKPDWKSFYDACDQDKPIQSVLETFLHLFETSAVQIWSGRCISTKKMTIDWLEKHLKTELNSYFIKIEIKMRPLGDYTPDDVLKQRWLDEAIELGQTIDFVFDSDKASICMWRRRGIFVFDCNQLLDN